MGRASQYVEITSAFSESQRRTSAARTTASLALPTRWCRASFAATVCWRAARRCEYSAWGCGKIASVGRGVSLLLEWVQIGAIHGEIFANANSGVRGGRTR